MDKYKNIKTWLLGLFKEFPTVCPGGDCDTCPYYEYEDCSERMRNDALILLKEQEPKVLTWDELEDWEDAVWFEDKYEDECYLALIENMGTYGATFVNVEPGRFHRFEFKRDFYKKDWRCWSARPTDEQRQAVKWE